MTCGRSTRRPAHLPLTEHMQVNVVDRLAAHFLAVEHGAEAALATQLQSQPLCGIGHVTDQSAIFLCHIVEGGDMLFRDNQKMHRSLGVDVMEGQHAIVLEDFLRGDLAFGNTAEQTVHSALLVMDSNAASVTNPAVKVTAPVAGREAA